MITGRIFDIQRFSIHDGPGIRTTVFFKGCGLSCKWCHNPESINLKPQLSYVMDKCIACGACEPLCPEKAIGKRKDGKVAVDWSHCTQCGKCAAACPPKALEMVGRDVTVDEVLATVLQDRDYYDASGGGITLSGGDPVFQPVFAAALLQASKERGLHTAVETAGYADWSALELMRPHTDLFLYDYKETDPQLHRAFIGQTNELILANLKQLHAAGSRILLRCPMIPEYNARKEHWDGIARLSRELPNLAGVEVLPYHRLGRAKVNRFGLIARMPVTVGPPDRSTISGWLGYLRRQGVPLKNE